MIQIEVLDGQELRLRELAERRLVEQDEQVAAGHAGRDSPDDKRHRQRRDERVDAQERDDEPVGDPDEHARPDAEQDRDGRTRVGRKVRRSDTGKRVGRPDREVDSARDEDERTGGRDDQRRRLLVEDVEHVHLRGERRARKRQVREERKERQ